MDEGKRPPVATPCTLALNEAQVVRINITIEERSLRAIDRAAAKAGWSRSAFFRHVVDEYFTLEEMRERRKHAMVKAITIQDEIRAKTKPWDAVGFIRKMRTASR